MSLSLARAASRPSAAPRALGDAHVVAILTLDLLLVVVTQKLAFPLAGREGQIASAFLIHGAVLTYLALRGLARISSERLILLLGIVTVIAVTQIRLPAGSFSLPSMVLMLATSAMLVVVIPIERAAYLRILRRFVRVACLAAALVFVDWGTQGLGLGMPDLERIIPHDNVYFEYNYVQPLEWGSPWMKPNGLFFLETSHVAQFIGIGLVIELALFRRLRIAGFLGVALFVTYGVTGLVLVLSSLPFLLLRLRPAVGLAVLTVLSLAVAVAAGGGLLDGFVRRSGEFAQSSSSAYNRFVLPVEWSAAALTGDPETAWLGSGAGSMPKAVNDEQTGTAGLTWPPYTKVGVEYGGIVLGLWLVFIAVSLFGAGVPFIVSWAAFVQYAFMNGSLNVPIHTVYCSLLCAGYLILTPQDDVRRSRGRLAKNPLRWNAISKSRRMPINT